MKRIAMIIFIISALVLSGCGNRRFSLPIGNELNYQYAAVYAPGGVLIHEGVLSSWKDHDDATVDLWFSDGFKFLAHSINVVMSNKDFN
jgi:hypothetical protein